MDETRVEPRNVAMDDALTLLHGALHQEACLRTLTPALDSLPSDTQPVRDLLPDLCSRVRSAFEKLTALAETDEVASVLLASVLCRHRLSKGLVSDEAAAAGVFRHATATAEHSHLGLYLVGCAYLDGLGVAKDHERAAKLLNQAAEQGSAAAKCSLSFCYEKGLGLKSDDARARQLLRESADLGYAVALFKLGCCHEYGILSTEVRPEEAHRLYAEASKQGHPAAMAQLGKSFSNGVGVAVNKAEACRWFQCAVEAGDRDGMHLLALAYRYGEGVEADTTRAVELYRQSGDLGQPQALYNLGCCYMNGTGVQRDPAAAVDCYRRAAAKGDMDAHVNLAKCLLTGDGVAPDQAEAQNLLMRAAEHGHPVGRSFAQFHKMVHPAPGM
ncbi:esiB [Symbiodinium natans]|uniref:EsiB protein n=1 Tax=Symbiodinium natans TaxID=878477 RepID=A0A812V0W3_9DINO|nr:esiB [Symbiodinium natans]